MKKFYAALLSCLIANGFAHELLYTIGSTDDTLDGEVYLSVENPLSERVVINKVRIVNDNGDTCLLATDFIIKPHSLVVLSPVSQSDCFGLKNNWVLDDAYKPTDEVFPGKIREDIRLQSSYTIGKQPDSYSTNRKYSLYFTQ